MIGANSVVTQDLPPRTIAAGVPARVIRRVEYAEQTQISPAETTDVAAG